MAKSLWLANYRFEMRYRGVLAALAVGLGVTYWVTTAQQPSPELPPMRAVEASSRQAVVKAALPEGRGVDHAASVVVDAVRGARNGQDAQALVSMKSRKASDTPDLRASARAQAVAGGVVGANAAAATSAAKGLQAGKSANGPLEIAAPKNGDIPHQRSAILVQPVGSAAPELGRVNSGAGAAPAVEQVQTSDKAVATAAASRRGTSKTATARKATVKAMRTRHAETHLRKKRAQGERKGKEARSTAFLETPAPRQAPGPRQSAAPRLISM